MRTKSGPIKKGTEMAGDRCHVIAAARTANSDKYLVIGGYGAVGRVVCQHLGTKFPGRVVAAGRNIDAASAFVSSLSGRVSSRTLDVRDPVMLDDAVKDAHVVITCVEARNREIAEACVRQGANFVDISASYPVLQSLEALNDRARASGVTGVLSVGLAPGITNLLVRQVQDVLGTVRSAEITLLLGLGDTHGRDAIRWMLENSRALGEAKRIQLPEPYGTRTAYAFDFADQHVVRHTLAIEDVRTRLCLEPAYMTRLLGLLSSSGALALIKGVGGVEPLVAQGEAQGDEGTARALVCGHKEARVTGLVASLVAESLGTRSPLPGVRHIEEDFELKYFSSTLEEEGFAVTWARKGTTASGAKFCDFRGFPGDDAASDDDNTSGGGGTTHLTDIVEPAVHVKDDDYVQSA